MASCWCHPSSSSSTWLLSRSLPFSKRTTNSRRRPTTVAFALRLGAEQMASLLQNKVLVAATVTSAVGQLAKPLTKALKGEGLDLSAAVRSGGMPSTHSAAVAAVSTSLGFERGFSDSIFGMSVVFTAIIMYDSQGVRREVGKHAKSLNALKSIQVRPPLRANEDDLTARFDNSIKSESPIPSLSTYENSNSSTSTEEPLLPFSSQQALTRINAELPRKMASNEQQDIVEDASCDIVQLNESTGHTEIQVLVGALLGFLVAFSVETIL